MWCACSIVRALATFRLRMSSCQSNRRHHPSGVSGTAGLAIFSMANPTIRSRFAISPARHHFTPLRSAAVRNADNFSAVMYWFPLDVIAVMIC